MARFCVSLLVHEHPPALQSQIENINRFLPQTWIVVHVSFLAWHLRAAFAEVCGRYPNVVLNPVMLPTRYASIFHAQLANYRFARCSKLDFQYFVLESSNSLMLSGGAEQQIEKYDFLTYPQSGQLTHDSTWEWTKAALQADPCLAEMRRALALPDPWIGYHEGTAFRVELFDEMLSVFDKYYQFDLNESLYPREELYHPTVARHLTSNLGGSVTLVSFSPVSVELVQAVLRKERYPFESGHGSGNAEDRPKLGRNFWGIKPVGRSPDDPVRRYIAEL